MADENPEVVENEEFENTGEGEEAESSGGEGKTLEPLPESQGSLVADFCRPEEISQEEYDEGEWYCEEIKPDLGSPEEGMFYLEELGEEEEMEAMLEEKRSLDSEYLKRVLGTPLTYALLDIATRRPTDPIQYLGHYLLKWRWGGENKENYEMKMKELNEERDAYQEKMKEKQRQEMLLKEQLEEELRRADRVESSLEDDFGEEEQFIE